MIRNEHQIHILINLNGYTKGARNEVFVLRPAPIQVCRELLQHDTPPPLCAMAPHLHCIALWTPKVGGATHF